MEKEILVVIGHRLGKGQNVAKGVEAQTAWLSAQSGKIDAQIDLKMSEIYLNKSMGTLK